MNNLIKLITSAEFNVMLETFPFGKLKYSFTPALAYQICYDGCVFMELEVSEAELNIPKAVLEIKKVLYDKISFYLSGLLATKLVLSNITETSSNISFTYSKDIREFKFEVKSGNHIYKFNLNEMLPNISVETIDTVPRWLTTSATLAEMTPDFTFNSFLLEQTKKIARIWR